jgi:hypothetical protein
MMLFLLSRKQAPPYYGVTNSVVIRAENENRARTMAGRVAGDEGRKVWLDPERSMCGELKSDGTPGIIIVAGVEG